MQAVAAHGEEEAAAADQADATEEGADSVGSPVAGRRFRLLAAHSHADAVAEPGVAEPRRAACIAAGAHHPGQPSESAGGDNVVQPVDGAAAGVPDEAALAPVAVKSAAEHVLRHLLDTAPTLASGAAR